MLENKIIKPGAIETPSFPPFPLRSNQYHSVSLLHLEQLLWAFSEI